MCSLLIRKTPLMLNDFLLAMLFCLSALVQVSLVASLNSSLALFPLHFIIGIVVLHRSGITAGSLWFVSSALFLPLIGFRGGVWFSYFCVAILGIMLSKKIFTNRSVYALEGLGIVLFCLFTLLNLIFGLLIPAWYNLPSLGTYLHEQVTALLFVIVGLYLGFIISKYVKEVAQSTFLIRER